MMLHMAIIGVGWAGSRHVEAIRELGRKVEVDCLVDPDAEFLKEKVEELGIEKNYADLEGALADETVDAVSICSPHPFHCAQAVAAAEAGKHVLCEKPMAVTVEEATRMIAAAEENGVRLYVAENASYAPVAQFLWEVVQTGQFIGELTSAQMVRGFRAQEYGYPGRRAWLARPDLGGLGTWQLHGIHSVGQMRYTLGEVTTVYVREHKAQSFARRDLEGTMSGLLTLESGVNVAVVQTAESRLYGDLGGYVLHGDRGSVRAGEEKCQIFNDEHDGLVMSYPEEALSSYAREMEAFADYVAEGIEGPTTGALERRSLAIVQAGYESVESGVPIDLKERFGEL